MVKNLEVTTSPQSFNNVTQCPNRDWDSTYYTFEALNMKGRTEGPSERTVYRKSASHALSGKIGH
jgi:hypothetical protein